MFRKISTVPRGSGNTGAIADFCVEYAKKNGCKYERDNANNVIIYVKASKGYENREPVILQGHIDMVCVKTEDCTKDMSKDAIDLCTDGEYISAEKTTLGGDDGIAVAYMLALLEDKDAQHPALELLFTSDEEIGMIGAHALDGNLLKASRLINIDSEAEGVLTVSCAGAVRAVCQLPVSREETSGDCYRVSIAGLRGGHSGVEINKGRINANKLLARMLNFVCQETPFKICNISGGKTYNAIPVESQAVVCVDKSNAESFEKAVGHFGVMVKNERIKSEPNLSVNLETCENPTLCMDLHSTQKVLFTLLQAPDGVQAMSPDIPNMVQTSLNFGILETNADNVLMRFMLRSNAAMGKQAIVEKLKSFIEYLGGRIEFMSDYPAWEYRPESKLRDVMTETYVELFGNEPVVTALHAGLECGILAGKIDNMDAVSFGPNILNAHTPNEKMEIASVGRCWDYLKEVLKRL